MEIAILVTFSLMVASIGYWLLCLVGALKLRWLRSTRALREGPPVTILKPVKGIDPDLKENLRSFCRQDYPDYQVIFGVADPHDPMIALLRQVLEESSSAKHQLVVGREIYGPNRKVSLLHQMLPYAANQIVVISDSDVRVGPDYLRHIALPFLDETVGLVTCLYRGDGAQGLAARLEAWAIDDTFAPSVMAAYATEGVTFAFGSTLALRRTILDRIGGFLPFADFLADDYQMALEARRQGYRLCLSDYPVACILGRSGWSDVLGRLVRWTRTHRVSRPVGYFLSGISHGTIFSSLHVVLAGFSASALLAAAIVIGVRVSAGFVVDAIILGSQSAGRRLWLLLPGDLLTFAVWALSFVGNRIRWRGALYRIARGGRLIELGEAERSSTSR